MAAPVHHDREGERHLAHALEKRVPQHLHGGGSLGGRGLQDGVHQVQRVRGNRLVVPTLGGPAHVVENLGNHARMLGEGQVIGIDGEQQRRILRVPAATED